MSDPGSLPTWKGGPAHTSGAPIPVPDVTAEPAPLPMAASALPVWHFGHETPNGSPYEPDRPNPLGPQIGLPIAAGWNNMIDLVLDGRMVEFNSQAGIYQAAATASEIVLEVETTVTGKHWGVLPDGKTGYEPDVRYIPTAWREIA
jgi:hypothetical protein